MFPCQDAYNGKTVLYAAKNTATVVIIPTKDAIVGLPKTAASTVPATPLLSKQSKSSEQPLVSEKVQSAGRAWRYVQFRNHCHSEVQQLIKMIVNSGCGMWGCFCFNGTVNSRDVSVCMTRPCQ